MREITEVPRVEDLIDISHIQNVFNDALGTGVGVANRFFNKGAKKAPITKNNLKTIAASANIIGQIQAVDGLMSFLENNKIIDGFDPSHDLVQAIYGELCMYLLKLDKLLLVEFGITSSINKNSVEKRSQEYLDKFFHRREEINKLQDMLEKE